jgi:xylulokinase
MDRTAMIADVHAFAVHGLTGCWATSWASADSLGLVDVRTFHYSDTLLDLVGLGAGQLPELVPPGERLGVVSAEAALDSGLPEGLPVVAGAGDGQSAGLGAAVCAAGEAYLNLGTAVTLGVHSDEHRTALAFRTMASPIAGRWTLEAALASGAHALEWFRRRILGDASAQALERLEAEAAEVPPGADGLLFLPYLVRAEAPYWDPAARGAWVGLRDHHGHGHLYRAVLEGIAFEQRLVLSMIEAETGTPVPRLRVTGGGARSRLWVRCLADILDRPLEVSEHKEATALGAAVLAAADSRPDGERDVVATARYMSGGWQEVHPVESNGEVYRRQFQAYRELYPALTGVFARLAR